MIGLAYLLAFGLYILISVVVVLWAIGHARKHGQSAKRCGWGAALVMYLLVFWDWIPTIVMHQYYCATQAGFWVYKTVDQWKKENPRVIEMLVANKGAPHRHQESNDGFINTFYLNQRFNLISKYQGPLFLHRWIQEDELVDTKNNEVLARYVDFSTSQKRRQAGWSGWKFWLDSENCKSVNHRDQGSMSEIILEYQGEEK